MSRQLHSLPLPNLGVRVWENATTEPKEEDSHRADERFCLGRYECGQRLHIPCTYPLGCLRGRVLERGLAGEKLIGQDPQGPLVDGVRVIRLPARAYHLGGQVVQCAAQGVPPVARGVDAVAEVGQLQLAAQAEEDVLGLHVAVHDVLAVQVRQGQRDLGDALGRAALREPALALQDPVQLAAGGVLEDQEDAVRVVEPAVEAEDARVPQVAVDLDLAPHVHLGPLPRDLVLPQYLQSADVARLAVFGEVDAAELALAERLPDLE